MSRPTFPVKHTHSIVNRQLYRLIIWLERPVFVILGVGLNISVKKLPAVENEETELPMHNRLPILLLSV